MAGTIEVAVEIGVLEIRSVVVELDEKVVLDDVLEVVELTLVLEEVEIVDEDDTLKDVVELASVVVTVLEGAGRLGENERVGDGADAEAPLLPDGVELGVSFTELDLVLVGPGRMGLSSALPVLSPSCPSPPCLAKRERLVAAKCREWRAITPGDGSAYPWTKRTKKESDIRTASGRTVEMRPVGDRIVG